jgi:2-aminophenol/2-amino-5-chlorophenol 1,6-dioxygenase alpha subunit
MSVVKSYVLPGLPHLILAGDANPGWLRIRQAMDKVKGEIEASGADVLVIYSMYWPSVIGHQIQARSEIEASHVDEEFHSLGTIPYQMKVDTALANAYLKIAGEHGLYARTIDYHGFPVDTGSIVVNKIVNPTNRIPCIIVSSNIYSDQRETALLGQAAREAVASLSKKAVGVVITPLSNHLHEGKVEPKEDRIFSPADEEQNQKLLQQVKAGRFEIPSTGAIAKPLWWMSGFLGLKTGLTADVLAYEPVYGTGAAVMGLQPGLGIGRGLDFEEPDAVSGERNILTGGHHP